MQLRPLFSHLGSSPAHRSRAGRGLAGALIAGLALIGAAPPEGTVLVTVTGLRSAKGQVLACLTDQPRAFPDCSKHAGARSLRVPAAATVELTFASVPPGRYAIAVLHDENGNDRLDKRLALPREGYGFSRDAPVRFGPPSFASAAFVVDAGSRHQTIHMRYLW